MSRKLEVVQKGNIYFIRQDGGGNVPAELDGMFTSPDIANTFIRRHADKVAKIEADKTEALEALRAANKLKAEATKAAKKSSKTAVV